MDFDEYNRKMQLIHDELKYIAERTKNQAWLKTADFSNPEFITLMRRHSQLTQLSSDLSNWMMDQIQNGPIT
jgi:putative SOS response-associated peptidase YedK